MIENAARGKNSTDKFLASARDIAQNECNLMGNEPDGASDISDGAVSRHSKILSRIMQQPPSKMSRLLQNSPSGKPEWSLPSPSGPANKSHKEAHLIL